MIWGSSVSVPFALSDAPGRSNLFGFNEVSLTPYSRFSDALRTAKTAVDYLALKNPLHSIGITSPSPLAAKVPSPAIWRRSTRFPAHGHC
jgi:uncharacterized protein YdiU (UPF0061 family)